jgi:hypothetical protein
MIIFIALIMFYILNLVWQNIKPGAKNETGWMEQLKPMLINSLVVLALLAVGIRFPKMITIITFEPVAEMTIAYTEKMVQQTEESVDEKVTYQPEEMDNNGFFRPQLRDKIVRLIKTSTTQFQAMMNLGLAVIDHSFSWSAFTSLSAPFKHGAMLLMGLFIVWSFFKLFIRFSFYFVDVIISMTFFAFLFPISMTMFVFKSSGENKSWWLNDLGANLGKNQFKKVIDSIVSLGAAVITYVVIMTIIAKFFSMTGADGTELARQIQSGELYEGDLSDDNLSAMTLTSIVVLIYIVTFMMDRIKQVAQEILSAFDVKEEHAVGDKLGDIVEERGEFAKKWGKDKVDKIRGKEPEKKADEKATAATEKTEKKRKT